MPQKRLPKHALLAKANGGSPVGRPRTRWTNYIKDLEWNCLGLRPSEMMEVMEDREVWRLNLELLPRNPHAKVGNEERRREEEDKRTEYAFNCYSECRLNLSPCLSFSQVFSKERKAVHLIIIMQIYRLQLHLVKAGHLLRGHVINYIQNNK